MSLTEITTEQKMLEKLTEIEEQMQTIKSIMKFWGIVIPIVGAAIAVVYFLARA